MWHELVSAFNVNFRSDSQIQSSSFERVVEASPEGENRVLNNEIADENFPTFMA